MPIPQIPAHVKINEIKRKTFAIRIAKVQKKGGEPYVIYPLSDVKNEQTDFDSRSVFTNLK